MIELFHVSEAGNIDHFEPRPGRYTQEPVVWAIVRERLHLAQLVALG